jgi:hypothetical protein
MPSELDSLVARVEKLEKQYQWLKSEMATQKLVIADDDGRTRALLHLAEGVPTLVLHDAVGKASMILRVGAEGPVIHLRAPETNAGLDLTLNDGGPEITLFDANGRQRLTVAVGPLLDELAAPQLIMHNANGTAGVVLSVIAGGGNLNLADSADTDTAIRLQIDDKGPIIVCAKHGKVIWTTP